LCRTVRKLAVLKPLDRVDVNTVDNVIKVSTEPKVACQVEYARKTSN